MSFLKVKFGNECLTNGILSEEQMKALIGVDKS